MNPFSEILARRRAVLFDGALATELERRGADLSSHLWSARLISDDPEAIIGVHLDHLRAGADVISSASYQASRMGFSRVGLSESEADARLTRAVELAHEAVRRHGSGLVAASLGPYGAVLADGSEYTGDYALRRDELVAFHLPRVEAALRANPDLVLFETLPSLAECEAVAELATRFPSVPFMASFSARAGALSHGEPFSAVIEVLERVPNVIAAGINCCAPELIASILSTVEPNRLTLAAAPNSGEVWDANVRAWSGQVERDLPAFVEAYLAAGARIIGGCCRTRPEHIAAIHAVLGPPAPRA